MNQNTPKRSSRSSRSGWLAGRLAWVTPFVMVCLVCLVYWYIKKTDPHQAIDNSPLASAAGEPLASSKDVRTEPRPDLFDQLQQEDAGSYLVTSAIERGLREIERVVKQSVLNNDPDQVLAPTFISPTFVGLGVDRDRFESRLDGQRLAVSRWRAGPTAPEFSRSPDSLTMFASNVFEPWVDREGFRLRLKFFSSSIDGKTTSARVLAEAYGDIDDQTGRQTTSLWEMKWVQEGRPADQMLESITVLAQEEVKTNVPGGQLLQDCTASILQRCDCLPKQLSFGIDQWARRIPGLDILGEHGLSVGDIDGNGLDDIYVCQPHGLPNLLLAQNPDGTVDDISSSARVDVLDKSYAALMIDLDNDQDQDLVVSTDQNLLLFSNTGNRVFQLEHQLPIGRSAQSISAADYDQDGDLDLFLCKFQGVRQRDDLVVLPEDFSKADDGGRNVLLRNDEGWRFKDVTEAAGITKNNTHFSRSAIWLDFDQDGDQDLCVANEFSENRTYENQGGWLSDVTEKSGITSRARHRTISSGDFNQDGQLDVFVATDTTFDAIRAFGIAKSPSGGDEPDYRDLFTGDSQVWYSVDEKQLWRQFFLRAPLFACESAFGSVVADLNNDGLDDIVVTNGGLTRHTDEQVDRFLLRRLFSASRTEDSHFVPTPAAETARVVRETTDMCRAGYSISGSQQNRCFVSIGRNGFANCSSAMGIDNEDDGRAVVTTDWDGDGDADLVMTSRQGPQLRIFCNQLNNENQFLQIDLTGTESNSDAIGSRLELYLSGKDEPLVKNLMAGSGNLGQSSKRILFGLGKKSSIEKLAVTWPNGKRLEYTGFAPNKCYRIVEGQPDPAERVIDRFRMRIAPRPISGNPSLPKLARSVFFPPVVIPAITISQSDGKTYSALPRSGKNKTLVVFGDDQTETRKLIREVAKASFDFAQIELDCVAVLLDSSQTFGRKNLASARKMIQTTKFPFRWGAITQGANERLSLWLGHCFGHQQIPQLPFAVMFDHASEARIFYSSDGIASVNFSEDAALCDRDAGDIWSEAGQLPGRWIDHDRYPAYDRLSLRLAELGFREEAIGLYRAGGRHRAYELCQKAGELFASGDFGLAEKFYQTAIETDPQSVLARLGTADLLHEKIKLIDPEDTDKRLEMVQLAATQYDEVIDLDPTNPTAVIGRANVLIGENRIDEAIEQLKSYSKSQPDRYEIHAIIGRLYFQNNETTTAAQWLVEAFDNRPTLPFVAGDLGFLYLTAGEYQQALKFLKLAHRLQPSDQNIQRLLAETNYITGHYAKAIELCEQVLGQDPNHQRTKNTLAWLLATAPFENLRNGRRAAEMMESMVEVFGETSPSTLEVSAAAFAENDQFDQAIEQQKSALALVEKSAGTERYSDKQKLGLNRRLELYLRNKPYRMKDSTETPLGRPGRQQVR